MLYKISYDRFPLFKITIPNILDDSCMYIFVSLYFCMYGHTCSTIAYFNYYYITRYTWSGLTYTMYMLSRAAITEYTPKLCNTFFTGNFDTCLTCIYLLAMVLQLQEISSINLFEDSSQGSSFTYRLPQVYEVPI